MHEIDPETELAIAHSPRDAQPAMRGLWALDLRLGELVRAAREPMLGEIRLTWWHDALSRLRDGGQRDPLLIELASSRLDPTKLASIANGWAELLAPPPLDDAALLAFAQARGGELFLAAGELLHGEGRQLGEAGEGWALADFAFHCSDEDSRQRAFSLARPRLEAAFAERWPKPLRPLGMVAALALRDVRAGAPPVRRGSPARQWRMIRHRLTGR